MEPETEQRIEIGKWLAKKNTQLNIIGMPGEVEIFESSFDQFVHGLIEAVNVGSHVALIDGAVSGALAPQSRVGDVVVMIHGCSNAIVLRKCPRGYRLVGPTWLFTLLIPPELKNLDEWQQFEIF